MFVQPTVAGLNNGLHEGNHATPPVKLETRTLVEYRSGGAQ